MSVLFRVILILVSVVTAFWILRKIRKSQVRIEDSIFWLLFCAVLIAMSVFPRLVEVAAAAVGVALPVNFVFLAIIFVLVIKIFLMSIKLSQLEYKLQVFAQRYAIEHTDAPASRPKAGQ
ncbi:MAG: DUF2304 domain-containing protein [Eubacteriales bacterium]|nr:DUF2304 domain-containing protein [Eubacteriales bacterium]